MDKTLLKPSYRKSPIGYQAVVVCEYWTETLPVHYVYKKDALDAASDWIEDYFSYNTCGN